MNEFKRNVKNVKEVETGHGREELELREILHAVGRSGEMSSMGVCLK